MVVLVPNISKPHILVTPIVIPHLHTLFNIGIVAVLNVLLLDLNNRTEEFVSTGTRKQFYRGLYMVVVKERVLLSSMAFSLFSIVKVAFLIAYLRGRRD